ncbi:MAG: glycosyltransferase family 2 protein [Balneolales bacterium]|nr:glycosyltransferase family 2 protein [Balneolales bacterium]
MNNPGLDKEKISVVVPLLDEAESLEELASGIHTAMENRYDYELIFVDDGSRDSSWQVISSLAKANSRIKGIRHKRNYGKSTALHNGFSVCTGSYVATMDADLQDDPFEVPEMADQLRMENLDLVSGWKYDRKDPAGKKIPSLFFNKITSLVSGIKLHDFNCGLKVYRREVADRLELYGERHRYIPLLANWDGYEAIGEKKVKHHPRKYGKSKFGLSRFIYGFLDLITLMFIKSYLQRPMHFFGSAGIISVFTGGAITAYLVFMRIFHNQFLAQRPLLLFGILLILVGFQFFSIGLFGEMMVRNKRDTRQVNIGETVGLQVSIGNGQHEYFSYEE